MVMWDMHVSGSSETPFIKLAFPLDTLPLLYGTNNSYSLELALYNHLLSLFFNVAGITTLTTEKEILNEKQKITKYMKREDRGQMAQYSLKGESNRFISYGAVWPIFNTTLHIYRVLQFFHLLLIFTFIEKLYIHNYQEIFS